MTYTRIRITSKINVHAHSTVRKLAEGIVVIPPGSVESEHYYFRGEVGDALTAFLDGSIDFPITNGVLDIYKGWTERRVAQDIADNWQVTESPVNVESEPQPGVSPVKVPRLNMKRVRELEGGR